MLKLQNGLNSVQRLRMSISIRVLFVVTAPVFL